jgi:ElaB/YqjD/DUF883 family membrane-anchored ribosome-binding protein
MSTAQDNFRAVRDDARERMQNDLHELKSNFRQLKSDFATIVANAVGATKSSAKGSVDAARDQANAAVGKARDGYEDLKAKGTDQYEHLGQIIGEKPVVSALVAFGVGFVLAKFLTRR